MWHTRARVGTTKPHYRRRIYCDGTSRQLKCVQAFTVFAPIERRQFLPTVKQNHSESETKRSKFFFIKQFIEYFIIPLIRVFDCLILRKHCLNITYYFINVIMQLAYHVKQKVFLIALCSEML